MTLTHHPSSKYTVSHTFRYLELFHKYHKNTKMYVYKSFDEHFLAELIHCLCGSCVNRVSIFVGNLASQRLFALIQGLMMPLCFLSGNRRHRCGQRGIWHHPDWRQLHQYCQGRHVGEERLRQHLQVPAVPADRQCGGRDCGVHRRLHHTGKSLMSEITAHLAHQFESE